MSDDFVENLKKPSAWLRILFMAGFVVALYVSGMILMVLMLAQILFSLLTADDNPNLRRLGGSLAAYVAQILAFLTYNTHQKPFPFLPFPSTELTADVVADVSVKQTDQPQAAAPAESGNEAPQVSDLPSDAQSPAASRKTGSSRRKKPAATDEQDSDV
jgi:hypothetical protein